jgi:hypothetical protein
VSKVPLLRIRALFTLRSKKHMRLIIALLMSGILLACSPAVTAQVFEKEVEPVTLIQATLIMARLEQPGLPRYQLSGKDYDLVHAAFGNMNGLSAKVIKAMPMIPIPGSDPKKAIGWSMEIGDAWSALFQIEKTEMIYQKYIYKTWPLIKFRRGKILFLENGIQVSDGLEARVNRRMYIFGKDTGWVSNQEEK